MGVRLSEKENQQQSARMTDTTTALAPVERGDDVTLTDAAQDTECVIMNDADADTTIDVQIHQKNDQLSPKVHQEVQPLQQNLLTEFRRPLLHAKRRLNFYHDTNQATNLTVTSFSGSDAPDKMKTDHLNEEESSDNIQQLHSYGEDRHKLMTIAASYCETDSGKTDSSIQSTGSRHKTITSSVPVSPLTKSLKAFHLHHSRSNTEKSEMHNPCSPSAICISPSTPVQIPRVSFPYLQTAHSVSQSFTLESPPLYQMPQSFFPISSGSVTSPEVPILSSTPVKCSESYSANAPIFSRPSPTVTVTATDTITSTTGICNSNSSTKRDLCSPTSLQMRSSHRKSSASSSSVGPGAIVKLHKHLAASERNDPKSNTRGQQSQSKTAQLKQVLMQRSPKQAKQQSVRCPRKINCNNCGHKIDLTNYLLHSKSPIDKESGSGNGSPHPNSKLQQSKSSATNSGLTMFDLETICDTGGIDFGAEPATIGGTFLDEEYTTSDINRADNEYNKCKSTTYKTPFFDVGRCDVILPQFPHSDELTRSFVPIFSDGIKHHNCAYTVAEGWDKLDSLDVDEILQLLEATSESKYCNRNVKIYGRPDRNGKQHLESDGMLLVGHNFTKKDNSTSCVEIGIDSVCSIKGSSHQEGHCSKVVDDSVSNSTHTGQKIGLMGSGGEVVDHSCSHKELCTSSNNKTNHTKLQTDKVVNNHSVVRGQKSDESEVLSQKHGGQVFRGQMKQNRSSRICKKRPRNKHRKKAKGNKR